MTEYFSPVALRQSNDGEQDLNNRELQTLLLTGQAMSQEQDEERVCQWVCDAAASLLGASFTSMIVRPAKHNHPGVFYGKLGESPLTEQHRAEVEDLSRSEQTSFQQHGRLAVLTPDNPLSGSIGQDARHLLRVDVGTIQRGLGVFFVGKSSAWDLDPRARFVLPTLANDAALALENIRLQRESNERAQRLASFNRIIQAISSSLDLPGVFRLLSSEAQLVLPHDRASVALADPEGRTATVYGVTGLTANLGAMGVRSNVMAPLRDGDNCLGSLNFGSCQLGMYGPDELDLAQEIADQFAVGIINARLHGALQESNQTLNALIEASPLAIVAVDQNADVQMWNPAAEQVFGWSSAEVMGRSYPIVPDGKQEEFRLNARSTGRGEVLRGNETVRQKKDGSLVDVGLWTAPLPDGGAMVVIADITEQKQVEKALQESEAKYQDLYDYAPDMFASVDVATTRIIECNQTFCEVMGYTREEVIGRSIFDLYHPDSFERTKNTFRTFVAHRRMEDVQLGLKRKDGTKIDISLKASSVYDEHGSFIYRRVVIRDMTERKRAEETLLQQMRELSVAEERNRLAREIHDTLAQGFTGIIWQLNAAVRTVTMGGERAVESLERIRDLAGDSLQQARRAVWDLRVGSGDRQRCPWSERALRTIWRPRALRDGSCPGCASRTGNAAAPNV